ncbi:alpha-E domain-containing protein, partial [Streptomyces sp. NPDC059083]
AETCLQELDQRPNSRFAARHEAHRLLGRARSELEFLPSSVLLEDLPSRLLWLQQTCREVGEAVALQYFHAESWVAWTGLHGRGADLVEEMA